MHPNEEAGQCRGRGPVISPRYVEDWAMVDYRGLIREFNAWGDTNGNQDMVARMRLRALQELLRKNSISPVTNPKFIASNPKEYVHALTAIAGMEGGDNKCR